MKDGSSQKRVFPRNAVDLEKPFADDQSKVQMEMNQSITCLIKPDKARYRRMVPMRHGRETLETLHQQSCFGAMLIVFGDKKIDIPIAGQYRMNAPAAFPIAIGNLQPMKFSQHREQHGRDRVIGA
jgi:hypothetical protein